ncbi:MAG TPA: IS982 family transposase [Bacteroidia bacterium]|nr:IS982 family transposase [Bacteroidia bacterium]
MQYVIHTSKLIEIFCSCDDFCLLVKQSQHHFLPASRKPTRSPALAESEIMTIVIFYHLSGFKCFEYYYRQLVLGPMKPYFPKAVSYERFVALMPRIVPVMCLYLWLGRCGEPTGIYYGDSKKLPVCDNRRIHQHRVFKDYANRGKSSTGWFFGFKVFLVINQYGQIMRCQVSQAAKADNNYDWMLKFFAGLKGMMFTDKGFLSAKAFEVLYDNGLKLITGIRSNMKNKLMDNTEKLLHKKRGVIESVNDILMTICDIDHTRHRSPLNFLVNLFAGVTAYTFLDKLPAIFNRKFTLS